VSRLLAEPEPVEVAVRDGVPRRVRLGSAQRRVERVFARWRVESDWWRAPVSREYWKLQLESGGDDDDGNAPGLVCDVYQDRLSHGWRLSRIYD
jgi:hypothetical protein